MSYRIDSALGRFVVVEPMDVSSVLKAEETATVFKIISLGGRVGKSDGGASYFYYEKLESDNLIIVEKGSVRKTVMGDKDVYYISESDIIAKVVNE